MKYVALEKEDGALGPPERSAAVSAAIAIVPVVLWAASVLFAAIFRSPFRALASEDGPIEAAQAAVLLGCAILSACIAVGLHRRNLTVLSVMYWGLAAGCFWTVGEEISWGQRLLGLATPEWLAHNQQGESNLHNLPGVGSTLHRIVWYGLWVTIAVSLVTSYLKPSQAARWRTDLWTPPLILIPTWLCFLSYDAIRALDQWWYQRDHVAATVSRLQEPVELILYGGVLVFLTMVLMRVRSGTPASSGLTAEADEPVQARDRSSW